jgi:phosphoribosyl-dephospho-CoA transferase
MLSSDALARHDLVWLDATGLVIECNPRWPDEADIVGDWLSQGRPLVVTRRPSDMPPNYCALGLPLPVRLGKRRIALQARTGAIREVRRPPALSQVMATAPADWRQALQALDRLARNANIRLRVYGSMAWQFLTGETYVTSASDVDVLWQPLSLADLERGVAMLSAWEGRSGIRADGEILLPDGSGISWREWSHGSRVVLIKRNDGVAMHPAKDLWQLFNTGMECKSHSRRCASLRNAQ